MIVLSTVVLISSAWMMADLLIKIGRNTKRPNTEDDTDPPIAHPIRVLRVTCTGFAWGSNVA